MVVVVVGCIAVAWAVLIVVNHLVIGQAGGWPPVVASALLFVAYGAVLITRDRRAMSFTWIMVALFGIAVVLGGLVPLQILLWAILLGFALYLRKNRSVLKAS